MLRKGLPALRGGRNRFGNNGGGPAEVKELTCSVNLGYGSRWPFERHFRVMEALAKDMGDGRRRSGESIPRGFGGCP